MPFVALAQDNKIDNGTDPTKLSSSFTLSYENLRLVDGGDLQTLTLKYGTTIGTDGRTGLNLKLPFVSTSFGETGFGVGDFSVKISRVLTITPSYGIIVGAEAVFDTADAPNRGAGVDVLELSGAYAFFFKSGTILAPALLHSMSIGNPDPGRQDVSQTTFDLYYVPKLRNPKAYMTVDPAIIYDWETDKFSGALAVTYGQAVDLGLAGNESFFIKPSIGIGRNRGADFGIEVGFKVVGF
ncbi:hypothetical protein D1012_10010 [Pseudotabrizicola alkalilacus]|uniref:Uncharacterized protein n=2 Tax=Pseudotabrizicola alkalilacus TaxID=2305252 RepID=A0A411Z388_9RHOB|nr:hypothetical protein D1012_10010 [Pseudotabrizicola alkalilacus]